MLKNTKQTEPFLKAKWERSREILARPDITEERVLQAFLMTPREEFCRPYNRKNAYADAAMPIGYGQTISGPHMVSRMTQNLQVEPHHRVLEIGTGSGYQAAVLSELSNFVFTIEIVPELTQETDEIYKKLEADYPQYKNIKRKNADGYYGWEEYAPFDRIIVTAGIDHIPPPLLQQLTPGGIMVIPVGPPSGQTVMKVTKKVAPDGSIQLEREDIFHGRRKVIFVPFTAGKGEVHSIERDLQKKETK
jgi:protein-L-isoaspartate(D-aspartate) O-methyltransferase